MILQGKTIIFTSNSSVFLKLTKLFIENSGRQRSDFFIVAEKGVPFYERFGKRVKKTGFLFAFDEWLYTSYEALFNHWEKAEKKLLRDIDLTSLNPDLFTDSVNKSSKAILDLTQEFSANSIISIGSGYIPSKILEQFSLKFNIHPGILPGYKGIGTPEAIMIGDLSSLGWSIHELTSKIDSGKIISINIMPYSSFKRKSFAEVYISIYKNSLTQPWQLLSYNLSQDKNGTQKINPNIRFSKFIKYKITSVLNRI